MRTSHVRRNGGTETQRTLSGASLSMSPPPNLQGRTPECLCCFVFYFSFFTFFFHLLGGGKAHDHFFFFKKKKKLQLTSKREHSQINAS